MMPYRQTDSERTSATTGGRYQPTHHIPLEQRLLDLTTDAVIVRNADDRVMFWNCGAENLYGWKREEALGRLVHEVLLTRLPIPIDDLRAHLARDRHWEGEVTHIRRDGSPCIVLSRMVLDQDRQGRSLVLETNTDITQRKRAESALRESETRFRRFFELGLIGSAITSPTKGWVEVNDELCKMLGYARTELMQMTWTDITHPDDLSKDVGLFHRILAGEIDSCAMDKRYIRKDGRIIEVALSVACIRAADGSVDYFVVLVQDITERKRAEAALVTGEERYRAFIAHSREGIWRFEVEPPIDTALPVAEQMALVYQRARLAECNDAMSRMYGLSKAEELIGKPLDLMLPASDPDSREFLASIIRAGYCVSEVESKERDAEGRTVYISNSMIGIMANGELVRVWGSQRDITERKRAEEALKRSEERYRELAERLESLVAERTAELEHTHRQLRALATELNLTEQRERKRLATELHDHLAQMLVLVRLKLSQAKRLAGLSAPCGELLSQADAVLTESLSYTRTLVSDLSPPACMSSASWRR